MFPLLSEIKVYDEGLIRSKMKEAFGIVTRSVRTTIEAGHLKRSDILVSSLDDSMAKSGPTYCRLFADENRIFYESVLSLESLTRKLNGEQKALVLIDDFAGTGETLVDGLKRELELLRHVNSFGVRIIVIAVAGFAHSRRHIERFIKQSGLDADVHFCDELGPEDQAFSEVSRAFADPNERERAKQAAEAMGMKVEPRDPLGYRNTQALVVFYDSCPNNTLPIFWSQKGGWAPLFPRM